MPITIKTADHEASLNEYMQFSSSPLEILNGAHSKKHGDLLQSSFDHNKLPPSISANRNGFVHSVTKAYNQHHHLVIRPDDIWLAIITQFSAYVNAHAEELRHTFVAHKDQKDLCIHYHSCDRYTFDWSNFPPQLVELIEENIVDPKMREWIVPAFTTTTSDDRITSQVVMMGTLQAYFTYSVTFSCGIPTVTLEGEQLDYELILKRLDKLCEYGDETTDFSKILRPILRNFIDTFQNPESDSVKAFWKSICLLHGGSGPSYYSGWITAFCFWNAKGERQIGKLGDYIDVDKVPCGFTTVPITINDHGVEVFAEMLAGSVGIVSTSSGKPSAKSFAAEKAGNNEEGPVGNDTLQPQLGWFIYEKAD